MLTLLLAVAVFAQPAAQWVTVHDDVEASTSVNTRTLGQSGSRRTVSVRTIFKDGQSGGYIHDLELDCPAARLRSVHETILNTRGERVIDGPSLSSEWMAPPEGAPFFAVLRHACRAAD